MDDYEVVVSYRKCTAHDCPPRSCDFCESSIKNVLKCFPISTLYGFKELVFLDDGTIIGHENYFNTFVEQKHHHYYYPVNCVCIKLKESVSKAQIRAVIDNVVLTNKIDEYKVDGDKYMTAKDMNDALFVPGDNRRKPTPTELTKALFVKRENDQKLTN